MNRTNTSAVISSQSIYRYIFFHSIKNNSTLVQWWSFTFLLFKHNITCYVLGHWLSGEFCLRWKSDDTREQKWKIEHRIFNATVYWVLHPFSFFYFRLDCCYTKKKSFSLPHYYWMSSCVLKQIGHVLCSLSICTFKYSLRGVFFALVKKPKWMCVLFDNIE